MATISGDIAQAQTATSLGTGNVITILTASESFANHGTLNLDSESNGEGNVTVTDGVLTNSVTGVMNIKFGTGSNHIRRLSADFINDGLVDIEDDTRMILNKAGGLYTNNAAITIGLGVSDQVEEYLAKPPMVGPQPLRQRRVDVGLKRHTRLDSMAQERTNAVDHLENVEV